MSLAPLCAPMTTTCPWRSLRGERPLCPLARGALALVAHGFLINGKPTRPCGDLRSKAYPDGKHLTASKGCQRLTVSICTDGSTSPLNPSDPPPSQPGQKIAPRPSLEPPGSLPRVNCSGTVSAPCEALSPHHTPL